MDHTGIRRPRPALVRPFALHLIAIWASLMTAPCLRAQGLPGDREPRTPLERSSRSDLWSYYLNAAWKALHAVFPSGGDGERNNGETCIDRHLFVPPVSARPPPAACEQRDVQGIHPVIQLYLFVFGTRSANPSGSGFSYLRTSPPTVSPATLRGGYWLGSATTYTDRGGRIRPNRLGQPIQLSKYKAEESFQTPWHVPDRYDASMTREYRVRYVTLEGSNNDFLIFAPGSGAFDSFTLESNSACSSYDQDVLVWVRGTNGDPYRKGPVPWFEVETGDTSSEIGATLENTIAAHWFYDGSIPHEALTLGMTVVVLQQNVGVHPITATLSSLVELNEFLVTERSDGYDNDFTHRQLKPGYQGPVRHRFFIGGGSFGSLSAMWACMYLPWMFHAGIGQDFNPALRDHLAWQDSYLGNLNPYLDGLHLPHRAGWTDNPDHQRYVNDLASGLIGPPVDLFGFSVGDVETPYLNPKTPAMPSFTWVAGDEDASITLQDVGKLSNLNGKFTFVEIPAKAHGDEAVRNEHNKQRIQGGLGLLEEVITGACDPLPPPGPEIDWECATCEAPQVYPERRSQRFYDLQRRDSSPEVQTFATVDARLLNGTEGTAWGDYDVWEGLGASGQLLFRDVDALPEAIPEAFASTARGDVIGLRFQMLGSTIVGVEPMWRSALVDPDGEVFHSSAALEWHPNGSLLALDDWGGAHLVDPTSGVVEPFPLAGGLDFGTISSDLGWSSAAGAFFLSNSDGEFVEFDAMGSLLPNRPLFVFGGFSSLLREGADVVFASAYGQVMRLDLQNGLSSSCDDYGPHLGGLLTHLTATLAPAGTWGEYVGILTTQGRWRLLEMEDRTSSPPFEPLELLISCGGEGPHQVQVLSADATELSVLFNFAHVPEPIRALHQAGPGLIATGIPAGFTPPPPSGTGAPYGPGSPTVGAVLTAYVEALRRYKVISGTRPWNEEQDYPVEPDDSELDTFEAILATLRPLRPTLPGISPGPSGPRPSGPSGSIGLGATASRGCDFPMPTVLKAASRVTSVAKLPGAPSPGFMAVDTRTSEPFRVWGVATTEDGAVLVLGDPRDPAAVGDGYIRHQNVPRSVNGALPSDMVLATPFGFEKISTPGGERLVVVAAENQAYAFDSAGAFQSVAGGNGSLDPNARYGAEYSVDGGGAAHAFGMWDGGDLHVTAGNRALVGFAAAEIDGTNELENWAAFKVVDAAAGSPSGGFFFNYLASPGDSGFVWQSESLPTLPNLPLFAPEATSPPGNRGHRGASALWVDLNGDTYVDLVGATPGGRVYFFPNRSLSAESFSCMPTDYVTTGDLGLRIMSMDAADLRDDGTLDLLVCVEAIQNRDPASFPDQVIREGEVFVYNLQGNALVLKSTLSTSSSPVPFGPCGVRVVDDPFGNGDDYLAVGFERGKLRLYRVTSTGPDLFELEYESPYLAPFVGAYDAMDYFTGVGTGQAFRLVVGTAGGLRAIDFTKN